MSMDWASNNLYVFIVSHFAFAMFILALILSGIEWLIQKARHRANCSDILLRWLLLLPVGVTSLYLFVMYCIFPNVIGSAESLAIGNVYFSYGIANLCIGLLGVFAYFHSYGFRAATVFAVTIWLWGNVVGHIIQLAGKNDLGILNVDSWFWMSLILPILLIICIRKLTPGELTVYNP